MRARRGPTGPGSPGGQQLRLSTNGPSAAGARTVGGGKKEEKCAAVSAGKAALRADAKQDTKRHDGWCSTGTSVQNGLGWQHAGCVVSAAHVWGWGAARMAASKEHPQTHNQSKRMACAATDRLTHTPTHTVRSDQKSRGVGFKVPLHIWPLRDQPVKVQSCRERKQTAAGCKGKLSEKRGALHLSKSQDPPPPRACGEARGGSRAI